MKSYGKLLGLLLVILILLNTSVSAVEYTEYADHLNELGLFQGTDQGYELDKPLTREQSATMIVRLTGAEKIVFRTSYDELFTDVERDRWSFPYVMYCYENGITKGTGNNEFTPQSQISAEEFTTFVLRLLGYHDTSPETAYDTAITSSLLSTEYIRKLQASETFLREDMVFIAYRSLKTKTTDGIILARALADEGVMTQSQADEFDIYINAQSIDDILNEIME